MEATLLDPGEESAHKWLSVMDKAQEAERKNSSFLKNEIIYFKT